MARESRQNGVGNAAHADLKRGAVGDQLGDVAADPAFDFAGRGRGNFDQRIVDLDGRRHARKMNHGVAVRERHGRIDLCDDGFGALHGRNGQIGRYAERAVTLLVGARKVEDRHVDGQRAVAEKPRNLTQKSRDRLAVTCGQPASDVVGDEKAVYEERVFVFGSAIGGIGPSDGESGVDLYVGEFIGTVGHGLDQHFGNRGAALNVDAAVRSDELCGFGGCRELHRLIGGFARRRLVWLPRGRTVRGG